MSHQCNIYLCGNFKISNTCYIRNSNYLYILARNTLFNHLNIYFILISSRNGLFSIHLYGLSYRRSFSCAACFTQPTAYEHSRTWNTLPVGMLQSAQLLGSLMHASPYITPTCSHRRGAETINGRHSLKLTQLHRHNCDRVFSILESVPLQCRNMAREPGRLRLPNIENVQGVPVQLDCANWDR